VQYVAVRLAVLVTVLAMAAGCGYALAGRGNALPSSIRVIGVPPFENQSSFPDIDRVLTDAVRAEFQSRGNYRVQPDANGVDAVFVGVLSNVTLQPAAFTAESQASRFLIIATASIEFREVATSRIIWASPAFQVRDEYEVATGEAVDTTALFREDADAHERLGRSFARTVVTSIFEAF
jgi:hypothetical protein